MGMYPVIGSNSSMVARMIWRKQFIWRQGSTRAQREKVCTTGKGHLNLKMVSYTRVNSEMERGTALELVGIHPEHSIRVNGDLISARVAALFSQYPVRFSSVSSSAAACQAATRTKVGSSPEAKSRSSTQTAASTKDNSRTTCDTGMAHAFTLKATGTKACGTRMSE